MKNNSRNTTVISISLPKGVAEKLEEARRKKGQSRSALISSLISQQVEEERWQRIYRKGDETALAFKITSEEDIDRLLHAP